MLPKTGGAAGKGAGFEDGGGPTGSRILLVAPRARTAMTLSTLLEGEGYDVVVALGQDLARRLLSKGRVPVDLVLMAIDPEHGPEAAAAAKEIHEDRELPLVFVPVSPALPAEEAMLGAYGVLAKGSDRAELLDALGKVRGLEDRARENGLRAAVGLPPI